MEGETGCRKKEPEKKTGFRYETCVGCGLDWNVSRKAEQGWYICPRCAFQGKKIRGIQK